MSMFSSPKVIFWFSFGSLLFFGCDTASKRENEKIKILQSGKVIETNFGDCDTTTNAGVAIKVSLWEPSDSTKAARVIRGSLAKKLIQRINSYADSASIAANPAAVASVKGAFEVFQKNYLDFKKQMPDAPGCWQVDLKGDTVMTTSKALFYQLDHYAFTGGAHPNSFRSFHAFDAKTGNEREMKTFVTDSVALLKLVEQHFRKLEKLGPEADLEQSGYFLLNHRFFMPANYVFTSNGLLFYYNPYEIAPYVRGGIEFTITYAELGELVKKDQIF
ncbi:DUF3298 and DUF4163 domain-containing protein [Dyadobacter sp. CY323]|uniref:DUF3298 and DUF4163 domain-containing protein n=1 Tax=Dyadobacter sp. CY323 TaxID=2907302 RepID=UPI001F3E44AF|nr:DUF3298 and DUF4163 domain-containing protein [Dyadobacter sp. CY323]MCE6991708.1 DUF3298 and DUF4163 domain-containing protein [Dyadobacter sp. CY323]